MNSLLFLLKHSGASKRAFLIGVAGKIVSEALPMLHWLLLFHFLLSGESFNLIIMCFISVFVIAGQWLFGQSAKYAFLGAFEITHQLRKVLLLDIRKQPLSLLIGKKLGERIRLVTSDLKNIEDVFSHLVADFIAAWVLPLCMLSVTFFISPLVGSILVLMLILSWAVLLIYEKSFANRAHQHHTVNLEVANQTLEYINCLPMLKGFGRSNKLADPLCEKIESLRQSGLGLEWAGGTGVAIACLVLELSVPLAAFIGSLQVDSGALNIHQWLVIVMATVASIRPFIRMAIFSALLRYMLKSSNRLHQLARSTKQPDSGQAPSFSDIQLTDIGLRLEQNQVLSEINIHVQQGEHIAIIGESGAGKSTLLDIIAAFQIASQGTIKIGGKTLDEIGTHHWYQQIAYVTQQVQLFAGSLRDNLLIANKEASEVMLHNVIRQSGLNELITRLPRGLESEIGENGNKLSGGERQRLSIARALLHDAPIILLDEITSALDPQKQTDVLTALEKFYAQKTVITIAHRLNTITDVDRIYLLEKGRVKDVGTHHELLTRCVHYQKIWRLQQTD